MEEKRNEEMLPDTVWESLPDIPAEVLDECYATAEDMVTWMKPRGNSFQVDDLTQPIPEIVGRIIEINPYLVKWENNEPDKIPYIKDELDWPMGYEPRCDVVVLTPTGVKIGISLAKSSFRKQFCPYVKTLADQGLKPPEALTRFLTYEAKSNLGSFNVVKPSRADQGELEVKASFEEEDNGKIPF